jgi:hypothetical protein
VALDAVEPIELLAHQHSLEVGLHPRLCIWLSSSTLK